MPEFRPDLLQPLLEDADPPSSPDSRTSSREIRPSDLGSPRALFGRTPPRPEHSFHFASNEQVVDLFAASVCIPIYHGMSSVLDSPLVRNKTATDEYLPVILCVVTTSVVSLVVFITAAIYMLSMQSQLLLRAFYRTGDVFQTRKLDWELLKRYDC
eukprot:8634575-Pyramimonas_sp.AAC.2